MTTILEDAIILQVSLWELTLACTCTKDGILFEISAEDFEKDLKNISDDTYREILQSWISKDNGISKFIEVWKQIIFRRRKSSKINWLVGPKRK